MSYTMLLMFLHATLHQSNGSDDVPKEMTFKDITKICSEHEMKFFVEKKNENSIKMRYFER